MLIIIPSVGCDHISKNYASSILKGQEPVIYLNDYFRLQYAENTGAMLGLGGQMSEGARFYFLTITVAIVLFIWLGYLLIKPASKSVLVFSALTIAGGFGNLYDRAFNNGLVIDFMNMGIGTLRTGIFNVADILIVIGVVGLMFFVKKYEAQDNKQTKSLNKSNGI